jgi:membrane-bound lytic murein transglycosylase D
MHAVADSLGIDEKELRGMNPHIMHWCTPPNAGHVTLYLPHDTKERLAASYALDPDAYTVTWFGYEVKSGQTLAGIARQFKVPIDALKSINSSVPTARLSAGQSILIPIPLHMSTTEATMIAEDMLRTRQERHLPVPDKNGSIRYRVRRGDTVWELARLFRTSAGNISSWNNLASGQRLVAGQILVLYTKSPRQKTAAANAGTVSAPAPPTQSASKKISGGQNYEVQKGETLFSIARKLGVTVASLVSWNGLDNNNPVIYAGEKLSYYPAANRQQTASLSDTVLYRVCRGDNLYSLAQSFSVTVRELITANNLSAFSPLRVGAVLRIPMGKHPS